MRQIRNRGIRFARGAIGPYANKLSPNARAKRVGFNFVNLWDNQPETVQGGWTNNGNGTFTCDGTDLVTIQNNLPVGVLKNDTTYRVWYSVLSRTAGSVRCVLYANMQGAIGAQRNAVGDYYEELTTSSALSASDLITFQSFTVFNGTIGNIYITQKG